MSKVKKKVKEIKTLQRIKISSQKAIDRLKHGFFVVDVETNGLQATADKFIFGCIYGHDYMYYFRSIEDFKKEIATDRFKNKYIFAHNAEFDLTVLYGNIKIDLDREAIFNGKFILARKDGRTFADSMNIYPTSVKNIGKSIGIEKMDIENEYLTGNVLTITDDMIEYCFRDCEIVYKALLKIFEKCQTIKPTIAGLSLIYYRKFYLPHAISYKEKETNYFFDSYFGGRVECFKIGKTKSFKYDINSMYPYAMSFCVFPNPRTLKEEKSPTIHDLMYHLKYSEGLAEIEVVHKETEFGFLPIKKDNKLIFPNGKFTGTWNFPEIRFALEQKVIEIKKVKKIVYGFPMESVFKKFSTELFTERRKATGIDNVILKNILNNLYGKFAQRIKYKEIYMKEIDYDMLDTLETKGIPYELKMFSKERKDCYLHIQTPPKNMYHTISLFSSYITSEARVYLLKQMLRYQKHKITYIDTDCICVEKEIPMNKKNSSFFGDKLGQFKKEESFIIEIFGNKNYNEITHIDLLTSLPVQNRKIKGIRKGSYKLISDENGLVEKDIFQIHKLVKTKEAIRRNIQAGTVNEFEKENKNIYDKRIVLPDGNTKCLILES